MIDEFNKVVRSHEALGLGLILGGFIGALVLVFGNTPVKNEYWKVPIDLCKKVSNVETVNFTFFGKIHSVKCKDKRKFTEF